MEKICENCKHQLNDNTCDYIGDISGIAANYECEIIRKCKHWESKDES